jgi:phosphoribosylformylglycinamidine synthase
LIKEDLIISAHDVSDGGLFITLLESSMANNLGFSINSDDNIRKDAFLFGESPSRVVVSIDNCNKKAFETLLSKTKTSFHQIGTVTEGDLLVDGELFGNVSDYKQKFDTSLTKKMS